MNINSFEIQSQIDKYLFVIASNWSKKSQKKHQELRDEEMSINTQLKKFIKDSTKKKDSNFAKKFTELIHLIRPNHLIMKPIFAVLILR